MEKINMRGLIVGSAVLIVLTQIACTAWLGRHLEPDRPPDPSLALADIAEQLASVESAVVDVQGTADDINGRTGALVNSMGSVARACAFR
jgi:hypothetical protein